MGSFSLAACSPSSGEPAGLRIVANTWCPARANSSAVAEPMPRLAPVITILNIGQVYPPTWGKPGEKAYAPSGIWDLNADLAYQ
jgi:hypothetical protein